MKIGKVTGTVELKAQAPCLGALHCLRVELDNTTLAAADLVGAAPGDRVLLTFGPSAERCSMEVPVDAAAVAIVAEERDHD